MPVSCIDKTLVRRRFSRSVLTYGEHAIVQRGMAEALVDALVKTLDRTVFARVFEPGCGAGTLTRVLLSRLEMRDLTTNDIAEACRVPIGNLAADHPGVHVQFWPGDVERMALPTPVDLVVANAVIQWLEDVDAFHRHARKALTADGILAFSTFGEHNFPELTSITGQSLGYVPYAAQRELLGRHFEILHGWESRKTMLLPSGLQVLRHLKATGANALAPQHWTKRDLAEFEQQYQQRYGTPDGVSLTFHPVTFVARARS